MNRCIEAVIAGSVVVAIVASCGSDDNGAAVRATPSTAGTSGADLPVGDEPVDLDPAAFTVDIDNKYWPMEPGTRWSWREVDEEGNELQVMVTVSTESKKVANGITARIVRDTVTQDGEVIEDTFDWYAQDAGGTIWYLGEDTAEFEDGEISSRAGSFEAGVDGALPGVIMPGDPVEGMRYRQEYYRGEAEDNGEILSIDEQVEVGYGHFENAVLTKDTIAIEPDVQEYKLYAPGVGPVLVLGVSGGAGREELVDVSNVSDEIAHAVGTTPLGETYR
jgi:hypothetical protein